jgi:hypothetical protein
MKNITKSLIAFVAILAFSCSPDDVQDRPVIVGTDAAVLTAPQADQSYIFLPEDATALAERFTWDSANFDGAVEITYTVQMDVKGGNFSAPKTLGSVIAQNQVAVSVEVMNSAALGLKAIPFAENNFDIRIVATTGVATTIISDVTSIVITPYTTEAPRLWVPGGYQAASGYTKDWDPATAPQLVASGYGKTDFEGYVYFNASAGYKFTSAAAWSQPGEYGAGATAGLIELGSATNLNMAAAGYYYIKADTKPTVLTYSATATVWGVVGSATPAGWPDSDSSTVDNDSMLTYNKDTKVWTATIPLTVGAIKFRANKDWGINFGDDGVDNVLEGGGADIAISTAGTYLITVNLSSPRHYTYTAVKQ